MLRYLLYIFIYILLFLPPISLSGQSPANIQYDDLVLYRELLEREQRDSTYFKAYLEFEKGGGVEPLSAQYESEAAHDVARLSRDFTEAFWVERDYYRAFYLSFQLEEKLPLVSEEQYPDKRKDYFKLGEAYYLFLDNYKSIELLEKALSPVPLSFSDRTNLDALKIIGICYANIGEWKMSDEYFRATLQSDNIVLYRPLYNAYALSHLSCNAMLTGQYHKALALSAEVWPTIRQTDDYGHLAGMCYCKSRSYLEKGEFRQASTWVDSLVYFSRRDHYNQTKRVKQAYQLQADYYTATGNAGQAKIYNDSLVGLYRAGEQLYTSHYIARAAQEYNNDKIESHVAALKSSRTRIAVISVFAMLAFAAAVVITSLYRNKEKAYRVLAAKARQWADSGVALTGTVPSVNYAENSFRYADPVRQEVLSQEETKALADSLQTYMAEYKPYTDLQLTLDSLAELMDINRNRLSWAINSIHRKNFKQYINELRVSEAISLMNRNRPEMLSMAQLMEQAGFSGRSTFYNSFKTVTGLTPAQYWKNNLPETVS